MTTLDSATVRDFFTRMNATQLKVWQFTLKPDVSWLDTVKKQVACGPDGVCEFLECFDADDCPDTLHCTFEFFAEGLGEGVCIPEAWDDEDELFDD